MHVLCIDFRLFSDPSEVSVAFQGGGMAVMLPFRDPSHADYVFLESLLWNANCRIHGYTAGIEQRFRLRVPTIPESLGFRV